MSNNPLPCRIECWMASLFFKLQQAGCAARSLSEWTFIVERHGIKLYVGAAVDARKDLSCPDETDLTEFIVGLRAYRVFDIGMTGIALNVPSLARTRKGGKTEALVAEQLADEVSSAPLAPYCDAILAQLV